MKQDLTPWAYFLCGRDQVSGRDFEHRWQWIEDRIFQSAESFAVSVYAYAVMSNHCHVVLRSDPRVAWEWTDRQVAERWLAIFPGSISDRDGPACVERATLALLGNAERLDVIRQRLGSISWFMRALNEPIARKAAGSGLVSCISSLMHETRPDPRGPIDRKPSARSHPRT